MVEVATDHREVANGDLTAEVRHLRESSLRGLARMFDPASGLCAWRIRRVDGQDVAEGTSRRYTAVTLIGLAGEPASVGESVFKDRDAASVCDRLLADLDNWDNLGDVALTLWASRLLNRPDAGRALERLCTLDPVNGPHPTVEVAWALSALSAEAASPGDPALSEATAERLLRTYHSESGAFAHWPPGVARPFLRAHVACFADLVYPVQALSLFHRATGNQQALEAATHGGRLMCEAQGRHGQWWWHYDVRTGRVVEGYPVYSVHQDSMAPMALFALQEAGGPDCNEAVERGLRWLMSSPELSGASLIDRDADLIWRKVGRKEPGKLSRGAQAVASRAHQDLRAPGIARIFKPGRIDHECRPYHLGWILHAWPESRVRDWPGAR